MRCRVAVCRKWIKTRSMRVPRLQFLCVWSSSHLTKCVKKRSVLVLFCALLLVVLIRWKLICTKVQSLQRIQDVCAGYSDGQAVGNLCGDLCQTEGITSFSCHNFYQEKEAVFSGTWGNISVLFKSAKRRSDSEQLYWLDASKRKIYPSEEEFSNMIKALIKQKFNIEISDVDAKEISFIQYSPSSPNRHSEMQNIWFLVQDNEYLALKLYKKFEIFPKLVGTCGSLYAVQKLNSISGYWHLMTLYDSHEEWLKRVKIAIKILDFLAHLETRLPEPLLICNIKMSNFGVTDDFKKIMYLDLESVHPLSVASKITGDGSRCKRHSDCDFLSCRSFCNLISLKCEHGVVNNNLQIVCERVFLGWVMSGRVMVPGLLVGPHTPRVLVELLEQCANPSGESGTPRSPATKDIRKRLHDLLVHLTY